MPISLSHANYPTCSIVHGHDYTASGLASSPHRMAGMLIVVSLLCRQSLNLLSSSLHNSAFNLLFFYCFISAIILACLYKVFGDSLTREGTVENKAGLRGKKEALSLQDSSGNMADALPFRRCSVL